MPVVCPGHVKRRLSEKDKWWVKTVDLVGPGVGVLVDNASVLDDVPSGTNDWHQYTAEFVAVDNDATIRFILRDDSIGSAYFDDVVLAMIGQ